MFFFLSLLFFSFKENLPVLVSWMQYHSISLVVLLFLSFYLLLCLFSLFLYSFFPFKFISFSLSPHLPSSFLLCVSLQYYGHSLASCCYLRVVIGRYLLVAGSRWGLATWRGEQVKDLF